MDVEQELTRSGFFTSLPCVSLKQLAEICFLKKARKRETLFLEGSEGGLFFQLLSGRAQLYRINEEGREIAIKVVQPGEVFAEVILFEKGTYPVCCSAITDCELIAIPSRQFSCLLENQCFRNDFIAMLMKKQRYLTDRIMYLTSNDAENRFKSFLIEQYGESGNYKIAISKRDIATAIGVTPETLSRLIHRLTESGIMDWNRDRLVIDASYLKEFSSSGR